MADFGIEIDFNTRKFDNSLKKLEKIMGGSGGTAGTPSTGTASKDEKQVNIISKGMKSALKVTGITAAIATIAIFSETIAALIGTLVALSVIGVKEFFSDPARSLLKVGVFIVNGFISAIEGFANLFFKTGGIELPRFQLPLVLEAYDKLEQDTIKAAEDGVTTFAESSSAYIEFAKGLTKSFITNTEFQKQIDEKSFENKLAATTGFESMGDLFELVDVGSFETANQALAAFEAANAAWERIRQAAQQVGGGLGISGGPNQVQFSINQKASTTLSESEAGAGLIFQRFFKQTG